MDEEAKQLAQVGALLADPARAAMVLKLMDGSSQPTGELMLEANLSPSSASMHLSQLVDARILKMTKEGRHKWYRITTAAVARAIEALQTIVKPGAALRAAAQSPVNPFAFARTCFDHLAGRLGVQVAVALQGEGLLHVSRKDYEITSKGFDWLAGMGINGRELSTGRRMLAPQCLDYTERRHHIAGALGAALLRRMVELDWVRRTRVPRAVRLTANGTNELGRCLRLVFTERQGVHYKGS